MLGQQVGDALGLDRGLVVHAARAHRPGPQGAALAVADHGGLEGVLLALAGDERAPAGSVGAGPADLGLGAVVAQLHAVGRRVGDHIRQGPQPPRGLAGDGKPARGQGAVPVRSWEASSA
jgi:hypothetical protein